MRIPYLAGAIAILGLISVAGSAAAGDDVNGPQVEQSCKVSLMNDLHSGAGTPINKDVLMKKLNKPITQEEYNRLREAAKKERAAGGGC